MNRRRRWRDPTPRRSERPSSPPSSMSALSDQPQGSRYRVWSSPPRRCARRAFRAASQAGTKTGLSRRGSGGVVANILLFRCGRRTNRTAIDPAGKHRNEKLSVKARVARQPCPRTNLPGQIHVASFQSSKCFVLPMIANSPGKTGRFRTTLRPLMEARSGNVQDF